METVSHFEDGATDLSTASADIAGDPYSESIRPGDSLRVSLSSPEGAVETEVRVVSLLFPLGDHDHVRLELEWRWAALQELAYWKGQLAAIQESGDLEGAGQELVSRMSKDGSELSYS